MTFILSQLLGHEPQDAIDDYPKYRKKKDPLRTQSQFRFSGAIPFEDYITDQVEKFKWRMEKSDPLEPLSKAVGMTYGKSDQGAARSNELTVDQLENRTAKYTNLCRRGTSKSKVKHIDADPREIDNSSKLDSFQPPLGHKLKSLLTDLLKGYSYPEAASRHGMSSDALSKAVTRGLDKVRPLIKYELMLMLRDSQRKWDPRDEIGIYEPGWEYNWADQGPIQQDNFSPW